MDMKQWVADQIAAPVKKALPVLTFPAAEMMGITTKELIYSPDLQADAMMYIHDHTDMPAVLAFMDLSVEAEAFGSDIRYSDNEVPTVVGSIIDEDSNVDLLKVPNPREGRTGVCIEGVRKVAERVDDMPVIAGNIGPFSLAGRLMDVNEVMFLCYDEPELVHDVLDKVTDFIIDYTKELKAAGADGVLMAEPLAGLLSPDLTEEFSNPYVKRIVDECQDDEFIVIVHNCGSSVKNTIDSIVETGAMGFHLGNAVGELFAVCFQLLNGVTQLCGVDTLGGEGLLQLLSLGLQLGDGSFQSRDLGGDG
jgi:uroporphyrinogen decarboxylase